MCDAKKQQVEIALRCTKCAGFGAIYRPSDQLSEAREERDRWVEVHRSHCDGEITSEETMY